MTKQRNEKWIDNMKRNTYSVPISTRGTKGLVLVVIKLTYVQDTSEQVENR